MTCKKCKCYSCDNMDCKEDCSQTEDKQKSCFTSECEEYCSVSDEIEEGFLDGYSD